jgi:hypothetical protein
MMMTGGSGKGNEDILDKRESVSGMMIRRLVVRIPDVLEAVASSGGVGVRRGYFLIIDKLGMISRVMFTMKGYFGVVDLCITFLG